MSTATAGAPPSPARGTHPDHSRGPSRDELREAFRRMRVLSWITLFYQLATAIGLGFIAGGSQALKTEWLENSLAIIPPIGVLVTYGIENRPADRRRPFGWHRAGTVAFLAASFALTGIGAFLCFDNALNLIHGERPAIGGFPLFGNVVWHGWIMVAAMIVTAVPPVILARQKVEVAKVIHDKPLFTDADMNRANWLTNLAGVAGLLLVAFGFWWGDALAALLISFDILRDGAQNVAKSLSDVMDRGPVKLDGKGEEEPVFADAERAVAALPWVRRSRVLMREHGRYLYAEVFIEPAANLPPVTEATRRVREAVLPLDWRLQHVAVEFTDDVDGAANVLTREEMDIESGDGKG
jgi:divalent metal cation (Fe/Co/Zn/Cd) transporter